MKHLMLVGSIVLGLAASVLADTRTVDGVEYVYLLKSGAWKDAKADASYWSDGEVPGSGKNYLVADELSLTFTVQDDTFTGDSLRIGTPGNPGCVPVSAHTTIPFVLCSAGSIDVDSSFNLNGTKMTILSKADAPFVFRGDTTTATHTYQIFLYMPVAGAADAVFALTSKDPAVQGTGKGVAVFFTSLDGKYQPAGNPMNEYFGKIVVDGKNVRLGLQWHTGNDVGDGVLGADPGYPVPDAITLRNGGEIYWNSAHAHSITMPNRGVTVEETGGRIWSSGGTKVFKFPIVGGGPLSLSTTYRFQIGAPVPEVSSITVEGGTICIDEHAERWPDVDFILLDGTLVTPSGGFRPKSLDYRGGSILAGAANDASTTGMKRPLADAVGTCDCPATSVIAATPIVLGVEADIPAIIGGRYELLRLPTSVKELTLSDISIADREVAIETTADGIQHVYAGFKASSSAYVVPPGTPGVESAAPYSSWETAATNFTDAIAAATDGGCIHVKPGTYYIYDAEAAHTVNLDKKLRICSDDGTGKLATDRTILDGQSKTRLVKSTVTACCLEGLTFRNAQADGNGAAVQMNRSNNAQIVVRNCVFEDNVSANGKGVLSLDDTYSLARVEGCVFRRNTCWNTSANDAPGALFYNCAYTDSGFGKCAYVKGCVFTDNLGSAGAIYGSVGGRGWIENCHFTNNFARKTVDGAISKTNARKGAGAIEISLYSVITNCTFVGNDGDVAAVANVGRMVDCLIESNSGERLEALSYNPGEAVGYVTERCRFIGNTVGQFKNIIGKEGRHRNCLYANNVVKDYIMTFHGGYLGALYFENCTFVSNAIKQIASATPVANTGLVLTNTAFALNAVTTPLTDAQLTGAGLFLGGYNYTDDASITKMTTEGLVTNVAPRFVDAENGDYHLKPGSPLREKALTLAWMSGTTDLDGNPRVLDRYGKVAAAGLPDIGCYECALPILGLMLFVR